MPKLKKKAHTEVKSSPISGKGCFALSSIPKGFIIDEFIGEVLSLKEGKKRIEALPDRLNLKVIEVEDRCMIFYKPSVSKSPIWFTNHSCSPNSEIVILGGRNSQRAILSAIKPIPKGEEITCDYGETHHEGKVRCKCSPGCKRMLALLFFVLLNVLSQ